ncbi:MAG: hypothetical protein PHP32_03155, partial [Candidatus Izemoplasmatales bacterium]|nr:hypothetical protein [Candidatus Izemoplasmatales bacterium]
MTIWKISMLFLVTFADVRTFLLGLLTGFVLLALFVALILVTERQTKSKIRFSKMTSLDDQTVQKMIEARQTEMLETAKITDAAYFKVAFDLSFELMNEIARYYFPESKYPMYELSVQEIIDLARYITDRLETLVNGRFIRRFKNYRVSTIINLINKKKAIDNSKLMKLSKKLKVNKIIAVGKTVLNYANPIFWFRKLAIKPSTTLVTKEACKYIISIFGEETNKIYSKKYRQTAEEIAKAEADFD